MREIESKVLSELMKNSRKSDRNMAKEIDHSQPTVTRTRHKLEKSGIIKEYTLIPDLRELGIEVLAFTFGHWSPQMLEKHPEDVRVEKAKKFITEHPNVIFASSGHGLGMGRMIVTIHKNYSDYIKFMREAEDEWAGLLTKLESFVISLESDTVIRPLSFRTLMEYIRRPE